jgi:hypothetical protein
MSNRGKYCTKKKQEEWEKRKLMNPAKKYNYNIAPVETE